METKQAKTFPECCDEASKQFGFSNWEEADDKETRLSVIKVILSEAAELYNQETAAERDRLKAKSDLLLKWQASAELEISSLKEENERLKALEKKAINLLTDRELEVHSLEQLNSELVETLQGIINYEEGRGRVVNELIFKAKQTLR